MWTYERTHPWISFRFDPRILPYPVWILLGEVAAACTWLREAALPAKEGELINYIARLRGVLGNAALDGNTLSEDQVDRLLEGSLRLPPSQLFQEREVRNLLKAVSLAEARNRAGDHGLEPWALQVLHAQVMKELPTPAGDAPGEFRSVRSTGSGADVPPQEVLPLLHRLQEWTSSALFNPEHEEERMPFAVLRALAMHLYLLWIAPFAEGNGRTARLAEFQVLLGAGIPAVAAHALAAHASATRGEYLRQTAQAAHAGGDITPFLAYMVRGFADAVKAVVAEVAAVQYEALAQDELRRRVDPSALPNGLRLHQLAGALLAERISVPTAKAARLSPDLAHAYARLNAKTLQRDLAHLEELGLAKRTRGNVQSVPLHLRPFHQ